MENQWEWLKIENGKLVCSICTKYKEKLSRSLAATNAFINGSDNYRTSALKDHSISKIHEQACVKNKIQKRKERDEKYAPKPVKITIPKPYLLVQGFNRMKEGKEKKLDKRKEGRPFTDFSNLVEFERLHCVKFLEKSYF